MGKVARRTVMSVGAVLTVATFIVACAADGDPGEHVRSQRSAVSPQDDVQVAICHHPPGDPTNSQDITVGESALAVHLAHGDTEGACQHICVKGECCSADPNLAATCVCPCGIASRDTCFDGVPCWTLYFTPETCVGYPQTAPKGSYLDHACLQPGESCVASGHYCNAVVPCCSGTCPAESDGICP